MSDWSKIASGVVQGAILAASLWSAAYIWNVEHRILKIEYALGIEKIPTLERTHSNGQR